MSNSRENDILLIEDLRRLWVEGLASGDPQLVDEDWFASIGKRGMARLAKERSAR